MDEYIAIGKTTRTFGIHGELRVFVKDHYLDPFLACDVVFIPLHGKPAPFFVEEIRLTNHILLKLEEIETPQDALPLCNQDLFLRSKDLPVGVLEATEETSLPDHLTGYVIIDSEAGEVGTIKEIMELPQQILAVVDYKEKEILIPIHDDFLEAVNEERQQLLMNLPAGLLDL